MRRFRFRIATILTLVLFVAIGFAALREATDLWESGVFSLTIAALLTSVLLAIHRSGKGRALWVGFSLWGWAYLGLTLIPSIESRLLTTRALVFFDSKVARGQQSVTSITGGSWGGPSGVGNASASITFTQLQGWVVAGSSPTGGIIYTAPQSSTWSFLGTWGGTSENFLKIGQALIALIAAYLGGWLSQRLAMTGRPMENLQPRS